jgi:hypothetical protein
MLGHVLYSRLRFLASMEALENLKTCEISYYNRCKLTKFYVLPFNRSIFVSSSPFDLIHSNVRGSSPVATKEGLNIMSLLLMIILVIVRFI